MHENMVESISISADTITVNGTPYKIEDHVIVCNGVDMEPKNVVNWFNAASAKSRVFLNLSALRNATVEMSQE